MHFRTPSGATSKIFACKSAGNWLYIGNTSKGLELSSPKLLILSARTVHVPSISCINNWWANKTQSIAKTNIKWTNSPLALSWKSEYPREDCWNVSAKFALPPPWHNLPAPTWQSMFLLETFYQEFGRWVPHRRSPRRRRRSAWHLSRWAWDQNVSRRPYAK